MPAWYGISPRITHLLLQLLSKKELTDLAILISLMIMNLKVTIAQVGHVQPKIENANRWIYAPGEREVMFWQSLGRLTELNI